MSPISRGFRGQRPLVDGARVPPGQHVVDEFPVLSVGSTPHRPLDEWTFRISGAVDEPISWTWDALLALPAETPGLGRRRTSPPGCTTGSIPVENPGHDTGAVPDQEAHS